MDRNYFLYIIAFVAVSLGLVQPVFNLIPAWALDIVGTKGNDVIPGTQKKDSIWGLGGDDRVWGKASGDHLYGNDDDDRIKGNRETMTSVEVTVMTYWKETKDLIRSMEEKVQM